MCFSRQSLYPYRTLEDVVDDGRTRPLRPAQVAVELVEEPALRVFRGVAAMA